MAAEVTILKRRHPIADMRDVIGTERKVKVANRGEGKLKIRPLFDQILIRRRNPLKKTESGLYIPEAYQEKTLDADVLEVGPGRQNDDGAFIKPVVKRGDRIICNRHTGTQLHNDGDDGLFLIYQRDVYATVED